ncbi:conjugal transfer protein TraN (plasmid) [Escherichia coli]|nr:conjugal transfer protein TraN [Escherichia coli]
MTQACWAYRDKYVTQSADNGTCQKYVDNPACTLASRQCAFYSDEEPVCMSTPRTPASPEHQEK